jgi:hypothetical protein
MVYFADGAKSQGYATANIDEPSGTIRLGQEKTEATGHENSISPLIPWPSSGVE